MARSGRKVFAGKIALVVEGATLIAMDIESCLRDLGFREVIAKSAAVQGLRAVAETPFIDFALLNLNGLGQQATELILACRERKIPFGIISGHSRLSDVPKALEGIPVLQMPFSAEDVSEIVTRCLSAPT